MMSPCGLRSIRQAFGSTLFGPASELGARVDAGTAIEDTPGRPLCSGQPGREQPLVVQSPTSGSSGRLARALAMMSST